MFGFNWNGTLSRLAVGTIGLLLTFCFPEQRFWLNLSTDLLGGINGFGQSLSLGVFAFVAYVFGAIAIDLRALPYSWEDLIGNALATQNRDLIAFFAEYKAGSDMFGGLSICSGYFVFLASLNLVSRLALDNLDKAVSDSSSYVFLVFAILLGTGFYWGFSRAASKQFKKAQEMLTVFSLSVMNVGLRNFASSDGGQNYSSRIISEPDKV